jgi:hypothetical protein
MVGHTFLETGDNLIFDTAIFSLKGRERHV